MEKLEVGIEDFSINYDISMRLHRYYGGNKYKEKLPKIYRKLADILNSNDTFTKAVYTACEDQNLRSMAIRRLKFLLIMKLYDFDEDIIKGIGNAVTIGQIKDKEVLDKMRTAIEHSKIENAYFNILYDIIKEVFFRAVYYILQNYVREKEPALTDINGIHDFKQADFIIDRYHKFRESVNVEATPSEPVFDENGCIIIEKGDLFHGTVYRESVIESIAKLGLESGQLHGQAEDGETFFCIDFLKATANSTSEQICRRGGQFTNTKNAIVFVINHRDLEGPDAQFTDITDYDAYNETTEKGQKTREIVNTKGLPLTFESGSSILMGVPPSMISAIIVNSDIENSQEKLDFLNAHFPKAYIIARSSGMVLRGPNEKRQGKKD